MGLKDFFGNLFKKDVPLSVEEREIVRQVEQLWYLQLGQQIVAERYGALLSKCEFKTYVKNEEVKGDNWYAFNVEPNVNQTSSEFLKQLARKLIFDLEVLIVQLDDGQFYIADSFTKGDYVVKETYFTDVVIDIYGNGGYQLQGTFKGDRAIYIKYANDKADQLARQMNNLYADLFENVKRSGSNKIKYKLDIDTTAMNGTGVDYQAELNRIVNSQFQALTSDNYAILPMMKGFDLQAINSANNNSQNATIASANITNVFTEYLVDVGQIYNVPRSFMVGTYEENDMDDFLTFGLDPLCNMIDQAINRRYYGKKNVMQGTYLMVDTKKVKHFDILTISNSINKLISSGVYTINEMREILEEQPIDDSIGDLHWITRNYAVVGDYVQEQSNYTANDPKTQIAREVVEEEDEQD